METGTTRCGRNARVQGAKHRYYLRADPTSRGGAVALHTTGKAVVSFLVVAFHGLMYWYLNEKECIQETKAVIVGRDETLADAPYGGRWFKQPHPQNGGRRGRSPLGIVVGATPDHTYPRPVLWAVRLQM